MRYDCEEIKYILDHADIDPEYPQVFIEHIENCPRCSCISNLQPKLEELLTLPPEISTSGNSLEGNVLAKVERYERRLSREARLERLFLPILGFFALFPVFLVVKYWNELKSLFWAVDLVLAYETVRSLLMEIRFPEMDITGLIAAVSNSPLLILTLVAVSSLIWAFSIIEAQKALK